MMKTSFSDYLLKDVPVHESGECRNYIFGLILKNVIPSVRDEAINGQESRFIGRGAKVVVAMDNETKKLYGFHMNTDSMMGNYTEFFAHLNDEAQNLQNLQDLLCFIDRFQSTKLVRNTTIPDAFFYRGFCNTRNEPPDVNVIGLNRVIDEKLPANCAERSAFVHNLLRLLKINAVRSECIMERSGGGAIRMLTRVEHSRCNKCSKRVCKYRESYNV